MATLGKTFPGVKHVDSRHVDLGDANEAVDVSEYAFPYERGELPNSLDCAPVG